MPADSYKERTSYDKKMQADVKEIGRLCEQYNTMLPYGSSQVSRQPARAEACQGADFPWADEVRPGAPFCRAQLTCMREVLAVFPHGCWRTLRSAATCLHAASAAHALRSLCEHV